MKTKLLLIFGFAIYIVMLLLAIFLLKIWLFLILALPVTFLLFWAAYKDAWHEAYQSYHEPKMKLKDGLIRQVERFGPAGVVLALGPYLLLILLAFLTWPIFLTLLAGYYRGRKAAKADDQEQKANH